MVRQFKLHVLFMIGYWLACFVMLMTTQNLLYVGLARNIFLAFLPLLFAAKAQAGKNKKYTTIWKFLWVVFFPNSLYPATSFIYLSVDVFYWLGGEPPHETLVYDTRMYPWLKLGFIAFSYLFSFYMSFQSLYFFERKTSEKYSNLGGMLAVIIMAILSGFAVFWGRFLRLNSWDILVRPWHVWGEINWANYDFGLKFVAAFTVFILASYLLFKTFSIEKIAITVDEEQRWQLSNKEGPPPG